MVAEHSSIQSAMMLPEVAALAVALAAMGIATWWFSRKMVSIGERKAQNSNKISGMNLDGPFCITATGEKIHTQECNYIRGPINPATGTRTMKFGVRNMSPYSVCQPFSAMVSGTVHSASYRRPRSPRRIACENCLVIYALGFLCIAAGVFLSGNELISKPEWSGSIFGMRELRALDILHGEDQNRTSVDEIRESRVDDKVGAHMDDKKRHTTKEYKKVHAYPADLLADERAEFMQRSIFKNVCAKKLHPKNDGAVFHMAMNENVYTNSDSNENLHEKSYFKLQEVFIGIWSLLPLLANVSLSAMIFLSAPIGMIAWIIISCQVASALKRRELQSKHISRRKRHFFRCSFSKLQSSCLVLVLLYTNMKVAHAMDNQLRQLTEAAASTQQHLQTLIGALDAQNQESHRSSEAATQSNQQAFQATHNRVYKPHSN